MKWFVRLAILAALGALGFALCTVQVQEGTAVIVSRFGDPRQTLTEPGLHFKLPPPIDVAIPVDTRIHILDPESAEYLTSDKKNVIIDSFLAWRVTDPRKFHVSVRDRRRAEQQLSDLLRSVVGDVLGGHPFSSLVSIDPTAAEQTADDPESPGAQGEEAGRESLVLITDEITAGTIARASDSLGVEIVAARIKRLNFPVQNRSAVFRRMEAEREATAAGFRSEGVELYEKIKAETDRMEAELLAEAGRRAAEIRGDGDAQATRIYADAVSSDPELYEFLRALEVADEVLGEKTTLILPADHFLMKALQGPAVPKPAKDS